MSSSNVRWDITGSVGTLTFSRPEARNALTWDMYEALADACDVVDADPRVRVLIIRGDGGAFAAGTDIAQFSTFTTGEAGVAYEAQMDALIDRLERVPIPTMAEVDGPAVGGGCVIALACDLRVCSDRARFGVPVARTLGNCLSIANLARLVDLIGTARTRELLLTGRLVEATEALALGLATRVVPAASLATEVATLGAELATRASSTIAATKAMLARLREHRVPAPADDLIALCYGSADFREGVTAFAEGRKPRFTSRDRVSG